MKTVQLLEPKEVNTSELLTNLQFLDEGMPWPPTSQKPRLDRYKLNKSKFSNQLNINKESYEYIISLVDDRFRVISYRMLINLYRKVTWKTADLLFVERPNYVAEKESDQATLDEIVSSSKLGSIGYEGAEDVSIYGDAIYTIEIEDQEEGVGKLPLESTTTAEEIDTDDKANPVQGKAKMGITNPRYWFPVVSERNLKEIKYHVLAWVITRIISVQGEPVEKRFLQYQIHTKGRYEIGEIAITDENKLDEKGAFTETVPEIFETGLSDFAVVPTHGVTTSDTIFGIDDYTDLISLIDELQIRLEKIAHVLDKHSDPSMSGPASALTLDKKTGEYSLALGNYFKRDMQDDPDVSYITWDGKLDSSFKEMEIIIDLLSVISEMGAAIFDSKTTGTRELSGRALKLLYVNPLTKVARIRNNFDDAFKKALALCSEVGYGEQKKMEEKTISIEWKDGLPNDPKELAEIGALRTGGRSTDTISAQIQIQDGLSKDKADAKAEEILAEEATSPLSIATADAFDDPADEALGDDERIDE